MKDSFKRIGILVVAVIIIGVAVGIYFMTTIENFKMEEDGYYQINGITYELHTGDKIANEKEKERIIIRQADGFELETVYGVPLYYNDRTALCLLRQMAYYKPDQGSQFMISKLQHFTDVEYSANACIISKRGNLSTESTGFLYDGSDTYIFLEPAELTLGEETMRLSPLSYVVVYYDQWMKVYDYETQEFRLVQSLAGPAKAVCGDNYRYELALGTDTVTYGEQEFLLNAAVDYYENYL